MIRTALSPFAVLLVLAACAGPDPHPLSWDRNVPQPFEALTSCLARATPTDYQVVPAVDQRQKVGGVLLIQRSNNRKIGEFDVYAIDANNSRLVFRSAIKTVGGSSFIEDQARQIAASCS